MSSVYFIKELKQKNNHVFEITWNNGEQQEFRLSDLQKKCPCAACQEHSESVHEDVKAVRIVGIRYALRIEFTSGCSAGIYSYDYLKSFSKNTEANQNHE
jgi:DUF971 family protein